MLSVVTLHGGEGRLRRQPAQKQSDSGANHRLAIDTEAQAASAKPVFDTSDFPGPQMGGGDNNERAQARVGLGVKPSIDG
jgi:hypothetical protein